MKEMNPDPTPTCFMWLTKRVRSDYRNRRGDLFLMNTRKKKVSGDGVKESRKCSASYLISTFLMAEMKRAPGEKEHVWNSGELVWLLKRRLVCTKGEVSGQIMGGGGRWSVIPTGVKKSHLSNKENEKYR